MENYERNSPVALQLRTATLAACPTVRPPASFTFHTAAEILNRSPVLVTRT